MCSIVSAVRLLEFCDVGGRLSIYRQEVVMVGETWRAHADAGGQMQKGSLGS